VSIANATNALVPASSNVSQGNVRGSASVHNYNSKYYFSSAATQRKPMPPNLKVDPRSSFAPVNLKKKDAAPASIRVEEDDDNKEASAVTDPQQQQQRQEEDDGDEDEDAVEDYESDEDEGDWFFEPPKIISVIPLPDRLRQSVYNFDNPTSNEPEEVGTIWLNASIFGKDPIRIDLLKRAVDYHRARKRGRRTAHTKRIGDIRGSKRKIRPQKGQGMARAGHRFPGHFRGGAKAHGPTNETNYGSIKLNKKVRRQAVQHVLSQKVKEGNLILVNQFHNLPSHKTKTLASWLAPFGVGGRHGTTALLLDAYWPKSKPEGEESNNNGDNEDEPQATSYRGVPINLWVASGNQFKVAVGNQLRNLNVYDVLKREKLIMTLGALEALEARLNDD